MASKKIILKTPKEAKGFLTGGISTGVKAKKSAKDLGLLVSTVPCTVAGVFTKNKVKAAPVLICMDRINKAGLRGVIVNSGYANAFTGKVGAKDALNVLGSIEKELGFKSGSMLVGSTGKIGGRIPLKKINDNLSKLKSKLKENGTVDFASAIMTTDTFAKHTSRQFKIGTKTVTITGVSKGSGMIRPNMATMLSYIYCDALILKSLLKKALKEAVNDSFNSISVDNDESTNDTVLLFANGASMATEIKADTTHYRKFVSELKSLCLELAQFIVRDGEGASKFVEVEVKGAKTEKDAATAAWAVADSMLVKTALFGSDPNWGRIVAAIGKSGGNKNTADFNPDNIDLSICGVSILKNSVYSGNEKRAAKKISNSDINIVINLKNGKFSKKVWTTDLSYGYVRINAEYST